MGFFSRIFRGSDRIVLEDVPAETEDDRSQEKQEEVGVESSNQSAQESSASSPFIDKDSSQ